MMAPGESGPVRHALLVADGDVPDRSELDAAWPGWDEGVDLVVAADGGAVRAMRLGVAPDVIVGDWDSLAPEDVAQLRTTSAVLVDAPTAKDESDTELALLQAIDRGAARVTVLGAFGGRRLDHALANIALLAYPKLAARDVVLLDGSARATLLAAPDARGEPVTRGFSGRVGDLVSLLPLGRDASGVTTAGLRYPLRDEHLGFGPARGLSNVRVVPDARVTLRDGLLLVVEHPAWVIGPPAARLAR